MEITEIKETAEIRKNINNGTFDEFHDKYIDKL